MAGIKNPERRFASIFERRIVLYGAGVTGVETYKILKNYFEGARVTHFCDAHKTGHMSGLPIISPEQLKTMCAREAPMVVITGLAENHREITDDLQRLDIAADQIFSLAELDELVVDSIDDDRVDEWYRTIKRHKRALPNDKKRSLYLNWWCPEHYCENDILVYQPGKVGSSSICNSLATLGVNVTHVHMLTDSFIYDLIPELAWEPEIEEREIISKCSRYCSDRIKRARELKIITLVREPLSRDCSHFFYHMGELFRNGYLSPDTSLLEACAEGIRKRATQNGRCEHGYQFEWFNRELKAVFGVDVYGHHFDARQGYSIIRQDNIAVLVIKLERLNHLERVVGEFTGVPDFKLINANEASKKEYGDLYKRMLKSVEVPHDVVSLYYDGNRYMDHFYSEEEKASFLKEWRITRPTRISGEPCGTNLT
ncbi:putative capsular polysaccharide synthesis family protein [Bradyrhizobium sp. SZCCHNRI20481]|uniref:putative capsular polysaccharide synthesis family protein n=1 Tax=Bradyrhizobium sp. SZCCHNRI20481 TaxID=3057286 RepID=UPI0029161691|nr:putative capsular polysaccharide synthesis family protein [Bradyrhizobium sp. SZCCHNRI20481]